MTVHLPGARILNTLTARLVLLAAALTLVFLAAGARNAILTCLAVAGLAAVIGWTMGLHVIARRLLASAYLPRHRRPHKSR